MNQLIEMNDEGKCSCRKCIDTGEVPIFGLAVFVVCQKCGNKRCPKADDHNMKCTNSNELNQIGEPETISRNDK